MDRKYRMELFAFYDHNGIAAHLEKMAGKGWLLEEIGPYFWTYKRIEPAKLRFAVTYYPEASSLCMGPSEGEQQLQAYCQAAGWKLVARRTQMQIFCNPSENPVPLETDAVIQVENINETAWRTHLLGHWMVLLVALFLGVLTMFLADGGILNLELTLLVLGMFVWCVVELAAYYIWYDKAERMAKEEGILPPTRSRRGIQTAILVLCGAILVRHLLQDPFSAFARAAIPTGSMLLAFFLIRYLLTRFRVPEGWAGHIAAAAGIAVMLLVHSALY